MVSISKPRLSVLIIIILATTIVWEGYVLASPAPSISRTVTPGPIGPCTWFLSMDGTTPIAEAMEGGLSISPGDNIVGTAGQDVAAFINTNLMANNVLICLGTDTFPLQSTILVNRGAAIIGAGSGLLWNAYEPAPTELKWTGSSNSIPAIKIKGDTSISTETDSWTVLKDFKLYYSGSATGTDGIFLDGETGLVRHVRIDGVNVVKFSGVGVHSKGTTFDIQYYQLGVVNSGSDNVKIEIGTPFTGDPTQHQFYGLVSLANAAGTYALNAVLAYDLNLYGGTIAASGTANGTRIAGKNSGAPIYGVLLSGVNFEGVSGAGSTGLIYMTGSGIRVEGGDFLDWVTGILIGGSDGDSTVANGYFIDAHIGSVTNGVIVTKGAPRRGILGTQTMDSSVGIVNHRATQDGVYSDLTEWFPAGLAPAPASITVTASVFQYQNRDWYNQNIFIYGGTVSNVTLSFRNSGSGLTTNIQIASTTNVDSFLLPGSSLYVTYSSAPTMVKQYGGP